MKKMLIGCCIALLVAGCNENNQQQAPSQEAPKSPQEAAAEAPNSSNSIDIKEREKQLLENPAIATVNNHESAYKLVTTTKEYSRFGVLVSMSKYAKALHHEQYALLAPTNFALDKYGTEVVALLKDSSNKKILDEFVAKHIIKAPFSIKKLDGVTEAENIAGKKVQVSVDKNTIAGAKMSGVEFYTKMGSVISMDEAIDFPEKTLAAQLEKKNSKESQKK